MQNAIYTAIQNTARMSEQDRLTAFRRRWEIYYGEGEKPLKRASDGYDDSVRQNFAKLFVDKGVAFLFGKEIGFSLKEGKDTAEEQYLRAFWQANHKMSTLQKLATNGGVCGTAFVKLQWNPGMEFPRVIVVDPETVSVTLAEDDIENVTAYEIKYTVAGRIGRTYWNSADH